MKWKRLKRLSPCFKVITFDEGITAEVFIAGAKLEENVLKTSGGRVLGLTCTAATLKEAIDASYTNVPKVHFEGAYCRSDIGARALKALS